MLRRRTMSTGKRETVQVVEELKSSGTWMVPAGCKFVDVFIVGGGGSGASSGPERGGGQRCIYIRPFVSKRPVCPKRYG